MLVLLGLGESVPGLREVNCLAGGALVGCVACVSSYWCMAGYTRKNGGIFRSWRVLVEKGGGGGEDFESVEVEQASALLSEE